MNKKIGILFITMTSVGLMCATKPDIEDEIAETNVETAINIIKPDSPGIFIHGTKYVKKVDTVLHFERFSDSLLSLEKSVLKFSPVKAKTTAGIIISFRTNSPQIKAFFRVVEGENRGSEFGIMQNGELTGSIKFSKNKGPLLSFDIIPEFEGEDITYEIVLPHWANTEFVGLEIDGNSTIDKDYIPEKKKVYVAYGNSITHGTGQSSAFETYPFLLSRNFNWELFSLAVGGAKTSQVVAEMIRDEFDQIDYMTVLIGYNDYNGNGITAEEYKNRISNFLTTIREKHNATSVFFISPTYTTQFTSSSSGISIDEFRTKAVEVVERMQNNGDKNLHLFRGEELTSEVNLRDVVHFNEDGAKLFADSLIKYILPIVETVP